MWEVICGVKRGYSITIHTIKQATNQIYDFMYTSLNQGRAINLQDLLSLSRVSVSLARG